MPINLYVILLIEGFITISVEILMMRQLLPFFGGSVIISSVIIGFFLLFLALGYWRGGFYTHAILPRLNRNFTLSLFWLGIGLSYSFINVFTYFTLNKLGLSFLLSLSLYLCLILAPIVFFLGQTIPLTTNLFNQSHGVSKISGVALFLSTIGSFAGAIITALILFQYLGVAWTVVINCLLLLVLIMILQGPQHLSKWSLVILIPSLWLIKHLNVNTENQLFLLTNNYGNYEVRTNQPGEQILRINESNSSKLDANKQGFPYVQFIQHFLFKQLQISQKKILIIGAGGFSLTANGTNTNSVTYVDIDPAMQSLAENHFLHEAIHGEFMGMDARQFLNQNNQRFDVIISDAYSHEVSIPQALLSADYFQQLAEHLNDNGLLMVNIIANPLFANDFAKRIHTTIHHAFPFCLIYPLDLLAHESNIIYICPKRVADDTYYTDNLSQATTDFFFSREQNHADIIK